MKNAQSELFQQITGKISSHLSLVEAVAEVLSISRDSAYRRIRGETEMSLNEARLLSDRFKIPLDGLGLDTGSMVSFFRDDQETDDSGLVGGFQHILHSLSQMEQAEKKDFTYFCMEIPVFQIMQVPELLAFKTYYWNSIESEGGGHQDHGLISLDQENELEDVLNQIINLYIRIPGTEIICHSALSSTMMQILFFLESGKFEQPEDALRLFDCLQGLVEHLKMQAKLGRKFRYGASPPAEGPKDNYKLFYNEMIYSQNTACIRADHITNVYLEYNILSFLRTEDPTFCRFTIDTLEKIMGKSILISNVAERERNKFFNRLGMEVARMRKKLEMVLEHLD